MKIETKFNVGDVVYGVSHLSDEIYHSAIYDINICCTNSGNLEIEYYFSEFGECNPVLEQNIFVTRERAKQRLKELKDK